MKITRLLIIGVGILLFSLISKKVEASLLTLAVVFTSAIARLSMPDYPPI